MTKTFASPQESSAPSPLLDRPARLVQWLIRADAFAQGLAVVAIVLPRAALQQLATLAGVEIPDAPLAWYLARAMSALFVFHAALLWYVAARLTRFHHFVRFHTWAFLVLGLTLSALSASAGLPSHWSLREALFVVCYCTTVLLLLSKSRLRDTV